MRTLNSESTGIQGLDDILQTLKKGDNVVWQVDNVKSYQHFVTPYVEQAIKDKKRIVYIRFAKHPPLIPEGKKGVCVCPLEASSGFETFSTQIHDIVTREGEGVFYVFDCLSDLLSAWATDLMIGNFFMVTCPYLFKLDTIAYFAILRDNHSFKTVARIRETTQLLLDVYHFEKSYYLQPLKVWRRYSPTMFLPHVQNNDQFVPLTNSVDATRLFSYMSVKGAESAERYLDYWDHLFLEARELVEKSPSEEEKGKMFSKLCQIMIGRESRILALVEKNFCLEDLLAIKARMIGTGFIGGKAVGMLLARNILSHDKSFDWKGYLEPHDSYFIGSDVFYTYVVENGWWDLWLEQKAEEGYSEKAADLKEKMLRGDFPDVIRDQFHQMVEYYGQYPIIVRSSSLLEDGFGNAFAGKYESFFCVNKGSPEERYRKFEETAKKVFASMMEEEALSYRMQRGLSRQDEQMALLVQKVSGSYYRHYFFPFLAGVGVSHNSFVWHKDMDPKAGMLRLVLGLGTRAVDRVAGDYVTIVALDQPTLRPYAGLEDMKRFTQHEVDLLDKDVNAIQKGVQFAKLLEEGVDLDLNLVGQRDLEAEKRTKELGKEGQYWVLTFDKFLSKTDFPKNMQKILKLLEDQYHYPVDVEFTVNFTSEGTPQVNLLQCRPLQAKGEGGPVVIPDKIPREKIIFESEGHFMGGNVSQSLQRIIYIDLKGYGALPLSQKYEVARLIGRLNKKIGEKKGIATLLAGPGRWGTRDPSLGVAVKFAEINNISVLVELADLEAGFMPELSFGSHFFLDLVEAQIFYLAFFQGGPKTYFNKEWFQGLPNMLGEMLPEDGTYQGVVKVCDLQNQELKLLSDVALQRVVCLQ